MKKTKGWISLILALVLVSAMLAGCSDAKQTTAAKKSHDPVTLKVDGKDTYAPHNYVDGVCTLCGKKTIFTQNPISDKDVLTKACDQQGTVTEIKYKTYAYDTADPSVNVEKTAYVYTPYGYDAADKNTRYDVLYLMHGSGLNEGYWFAQGSYSPSDGIYTKGFGTMNVLDNMMKDGTAKKCIVVTPTSTTDFGVEGLKADFGKELVKDLMPYIAENYNTFAASSSDADLQANRDHQGFAGLSAGSMLTYSTIWPECLGYFAYIGSYSGSSFGEDSWNLIVERRNTVYKDLDVKYWLAGVGSTETNTSYPGDPFGSYRVLIGGMQGMQQGSDLSAGDNCDFIQVAGTAHNYATWITLLYDSLLVFFQK